MSCGLHTVVKLLLAVESVSKINHDGQSGALELLLVTPLPVESIIAALKWACRAHFRRPLLALCLQNAVLMEYVFAFSRPLAVSAGDEWIFAVLFVGGVAALVGDSVALHWLGLWRGLSTRQAYKAVIITVAQVLGPCWLIAVLVIFGQPNLGSAFGTGAAFALWFVIGLVVDAITIVWVRSRLIGQFRSVVATRYDKAD
jgi:hypothetical protein